MPIRKKIRQSYRYDFGIGDLSIIVKKPMHKSKHAKRRFVIAKTMFKRHIKKAILIDYQDDKSKSK